jgi:hypothetical protein
VGKLAHDNDVHAAVKLLGPFEETACTSYFTGGFDHMLQNSTSPMSVQLKTDTGQVLPWSITLDDLRTPPTTVAARTSATLSPEVTKRIDCIIQYPDSRALVDLCIALS